MYKEFSKVYDLMMEYSDYDKWREIVEAKFKLYNPTGTKVLDLGCGTGELIKRLQGDYEVVGVDLSQGMIDIAKEKVDGIEFYVQDMRNFKLKEKNDIILSLFDTINHLISIEALEATLEAVYNNLKEDGIYIFDIVTEELMEEMFPGGYFVDERDDLTIVWGHEYEEEDGLDYIDASFFIKQKDGSYRKVTEEYVKKIFTPEEIIEAAKKIGFEVKEVAQDGTLAGERIFFTLQK